MAAVVVGGRFLPPATGGETDPKKSLFFEDLNVLRMQCRGIGARIDFGTKAHADGWQGYHFEMADNRFGRVGQVFHGLSALLVRSQPGQALPQGSVAFGTTQCHQYRQAQARDQGQVPCHCSKVDLGLLRYPGQKAWQAFAMLQMTPAPGGHGGQQVWATGRIVGEKRIEPATGYVRAGTADGPDTSTQQLQLAGLCRLLSSVTQGHAERVRHINVFEAVT